MSAKFTANINIFHSNWNSPNVRFILLTWVKLLKEKEIFTKSWNQSKQNGHSYFIQLEIGTKIVMFLKFKKISQSNDQIVIDLSEWREFESEIFREYRKELVMSKSPLRKSTVFHMIQVKNLWMNLWILDTEIVFFCLQVNIYYKWLFMKKWVSLKYSTEIRRIVSVPLRFSLFGSRKIETICDKRYKKEKFKVQPENLALFRRKYGVVHIKESDSELEN